MEDLMLNILYIISGLCLLIAGKAFKEGLEDIRQMEILDEMEKR